MVKKTELSQSLQKGSGWQKWASCKEDSKGFTKMPVLERSWHCSFCKTDEFCISSFLVNLPKVCCKKELYWEWSVVCTYSTLYNTELREWVTCDLGYFEHTIECLMYRTSSWGYICLPWGTENKLIHVLPV